MEGVPLPRAAAADEDEDEDPMLAMLDWMEYDQARQAFLYPCERCGAVVVLERIDVEEGGGGCAACGGRVLLLDDDEFEGGPPLPFDSETINHATLSVAGRLTYELRVLPGTRVSWKFAEGSGQSVGFTATYAVNNSEFEPQPPITIVQPAARSDHSAFFTMRSGGRLLLIFEHERGDGSEVTEVASGSLPEDDDQEEAQALRMPEPEPEPEVVVPPPGSGGFSTDAESGGGGGSIYGALSAPAVGLGSGSGRPSGGGSGNSLRVSLAISRLPPFVTAEGDLSGVIGAPSSSGSGSGKKSGGSGGRGSKGGGSSLEMAPMAGATGGLRDGGGFTIAEGTVLPKGSKKPPTVGGGLAETLL